jgi:1-acyl-sn-glycerol-3-phosphate acyltransferase
VRLAAQAGVPIVPVAVVGSETGLKGTLQRKPIHLTIGEPFRVILDDDGKIMPERMEHLTTEMMQRISALLPPERRGVYALPESDPKPSSAG